MKNLFQPEAAAEVLARLAQLQPTAARQWGKMEVAQMLAHCSGALEIACGDRNVPRTLLGRLIGGFLKKDYVSDKPLGHDSPTAAVLIVTDARDFEAEKNRLAGLIRRFQQGGPEKCTRAPHGFFGPMTTEEWAIAQYKHLDHHFRQFGG